MTLGLKRGTVALVPHEAAWEAEAARTIEKLKGILGDTAVDIQHVGSTAIPAICAKPIVDIAVAVRSFADINAMQAELEARGFYRRSWNDEDQELFACGSWYDGTGDKQTHFIHVTVKRTDFVVCRCRPTADTEISRSIEYRPPKGSIGVELSVMVENKLGSISVQIVDGVELNPRGLRIKKAGNRRTS